MEIKKVMQSILAVVVLQSLASGAWAASQSGDSVSFEVPQYGIKGTGFKTTSNQIRLETLAARSTMQLKISGAPLSPTVEAAKKYCSAMGKFLGRTKKSSGIVYRLSASVYPFHDAALAGSPYVIENRPQYEGARISIGKSENLFSSAEDLKAFETLLEQKIELQASSIQANGVLSLDVAQQDDVICDLVLGNVVLKVEVGYRIQPAQPEIQSVLSETDFSKVYEDVRLKASSSEDIVDRLVWDSSILTRSLTSLLGTSVDVMGERRFVDLFGVMFDRKKGNLKLYTPDQYSAAIHSIDRKKYFDRHEVLSQDVETQVVVK